mmetsp:Transcript_80773/g.207960  ORF Transcript_80773/g.207960 Transcript_80773/m.207960 type:complete len:88 (-) Transcript_80773:69-332(-)
MTPRRRGLAAAVVLASVAGLAAKECGQPAAVAVLAAAVLAVAAALVAKERGQLAAGGLKSRGRRTARDGSPRQPSQHLLEPVTPHPR